MSGSEILRLFVGATYRVAAEINPRGYNWSETYLDQALAEAKSILAASPSATSATSAPEAGSGEVRKAVAIDILEAFRDGSPDLDRTLSMDWRDWTDEADAAIRVLTSSPSAPVAGEVTYPKSHAAADAAALLFSRPGKTFDDFLSAFGAFEKALSAALTSAPVAESVGEGLREAMEAAICKAREDGASDDDIVTHRLAYSYLEQALPTAGSVQACPECAERERLATIIRATPIYREMRDVYQGQAGYRTPSQIADGQWFTGQPTPGATIPTAPSLEEQP